MSMFERARAAWEIQRESEHVARTEHDRRLRDEFAELLRTLTGVSDFTVLGCGERMRAEIEGVVFAPDMWYYAIIGSMWAVLIVTERSDGTRRTSDPIRTTGELGRELERLVNAQPTSFESDL
jgi:hypothetical protein